MGSSGSATIPATPLLPVGYDLSLTVKNLTITPVSVDVALYGTTTGGWIGWMRDPFAAGDLFAGKDQRLDKLQGLMGAGGGPAMSEDGAVLVRTIAKSDTGDEQVLHQRVKILRNGYAPPVAIQAEPPLFVGLWTNPAEAFHVWRAQDGHPVTWMTLAGHLVNTSSDDIRLTDVSLQILSGPEVLWSETVPAFAWPLSVFTGNPPAYQSVDVAPNGDVVVPAGWLSFIQGIPLPDHFKTTGTLTVRAHYVYRGRCQEANWKGLIRLVNPVEVRSPVVGSWNWGNAADHSSWDVHAMAGAPLLE